MFIVIIIIVLQFHCMLYQLPVNM